MFVFEDFIVFRNILIREDFSVVRIVLSFYTFHFTIIPPLSGTLFELNSYQKGRRVFLKLVKFSNLLTIYFLQTEDLMTLRKLQTDLMQMQQVNSQLRREYQMLKIEFERNLIANEQTGPLNKEMRHLLARLQKHNKHLKHEAQRYKRKYKELSAELNLVSGLLHSSLLLSVGDGRVGGKLNFEC